MMPVIGESEELFVGLFRQMHVPSIYDLRLLEARRYLQRSPIQITFFRMRHEELVVVIRVFAALLIGALIGFERTFHGRPAGFRTHSLVCVASALHARDGLSKPVDDRDAT
jgi:hypothetical protein